MPEVLIDVSRLLSRFRKGQLPTGVDRVGLAYIGHYAGHADAVVRIRDNYYVLSRRASRTMFQLLLSRPDSFSTPSLIACLKGIVEGGRRNKSANRFLLNTGHTGLEQPTYPDMLRRMGVKPIFFVHDLIPITHPEYCRPGEREKHTIRMKNVLSVGCGVITNSQTTLNQLADYAHLIGQAMPPSVAALLAPGISPRQCLGERLFDKPYFIVLGTIEARKNHLILLQIWRRLVELFGNNTPHLLIIGQRGWECENVVDMLERCEQLRGFITEINQCPDATLSTYLHHAQALLMPSFAEGYGIPLIEALASGVPVIASDLPVFREIAGDIPKYLDPLDGLGWLKAVQEYSDANSCGRRAQLQMICTLKPPQWTEHFKKVDDFLDSLALESRTAFRGRIP